MPAVPDMDVHTVEEYGYDELVPGGTDRDVAQLEASVRTCRGLGLERANVPPDFPIDLADRLQTAGIELVVDRTFVVDEAPAELRRYHELTRESLAHAHRRRRDRARARLLPAGLRMPTGGLGARDRGRRRVADRFPHDLEF